MKKHEEINNPNSCFNKARPDENIFVLLERDCAFAHTIITWCSYRVLVGANGKDDQQILEALQQAKAFLAQKKRYGVSDSLDAAS